MTSLFSVLLVVLYCFAFFFLFIYFIFHLVLFVLNFHSGQVTSKGNRVKLRTQVKRPGHKQNEEYWNRVHWSETGWKSNLCQGIETDWKRGIIWENKAVKVLVIMCIKRDSDSLAYFMRLQITDWDWQICRLLSILLCRILSGI